MDDEWIYGGRLEQIHQTMVEGRPNGMPAWGGKIPDQQLWQLAAYVRSMSLPQTLAAQNGPTPSQSPAPVPAKPIRMPAGRRRPTPPMITPPRPRVPIERDGVSRAGAALPRHVLRGARLPRTLRRLR